MTEQTSSPPIVPDQDFSSVMALVALLADPAGAKARIEALVAQQALLKEVTASLIEEREKHETARASVHTAEAASKARIAAEQAAHVEACAKRERALNVREAQTAKAEAATEREREAVSKLKSDLSRRLDVVRKAGAAAAA